MPGGGSPEAASDSGHGPDPAGHGDDRIGTGGDDAATGRFGAGSQRHGHLRNAFANVDGDAVGRDKYVFLLGGARERLRPLSPVLRERIQNAYEEAPEYDEARVALAKQSIAVLRGADGLGKAATAVRLLLPCRGPVYHLDSGVDFASLADRLDTSASDGSGMGIESGAGFLLDRPADAANLRGEIFDRLQTALLGANAVMVVTVADTDVADSELLTGVVDLTRPPVLRGIVRRYLRWRFGVREAERMLADADVEALLAEHLDANATCGSAADLATALHDEYQSGEPDLGRVRDRMARKGVETFAIWADGLTEPFIRCFSLALAVLNGLPQEDITDAARMLERRLDAVRVPAGSQDPAVRYKPLPAHDPLALPMRKLLARLRARRVDAPGTGRCLEYQDPDYPRQVLAHAWSEYPIQELLLEWLGELVTDRSDEVRVYAAVALGGLLPTAFAYLSRRVLAGWAFHQDERFREAVACALSIGVGDAELRPQIDMLVAEWFADRNRPLGQATAARVYGLLPASGDAGQNIMRLARLSAVDSIKVAVAIGNGYTDLLADDYTLAPLVLGALRTGLLPPQTRPTCLLAFLIMATGLAIDGTQPEFDGYDGWPALLFLSELRPEVRDPLVLLWREALGQPFSHRQAQLTLRNWAALAETDSRLRDTFLDMVGALVHDDARSGRIIRRYAAEWTDRDELAPLPLTAWAVNRVLDREKV
ncbi:hypothetical protein [Streptomyces sp. SPB162]|uniref:hypothetical protein n=1 Tax=Streptomyces sp. SPB162 TaxID=2940560 RepID=UPI002406817F|nr:hypothetical protein [Streptomyces sp. SPB162]MDF9814789.1 hypothetical protein [Streptomyces sp. SPB162]